MTTNPTTEFYHLFSYLYDHYNRTLFDGQLQMPIIVVTRKKNVFGYYSYQRWKDAKSNLVDEIALNPLMFDKYPIIEICQTIVHEMCHQWQYQYGTPTRSGYHNKEWADKMEQIGLMPTSTGQPGGTVTGQKMADYPIPNGLFSLHTKTLQNSELFQKLYYENVLDHLPGSESGHIHYHLSDSDFNTGGPSSETETTNLIAQLEQSDSFMLMLEDRDGFRKKPQNDLKPRCMDPVYIQQQNEKKIKIKYSCAICDTNVWGKSGLSIICGCCKSKYVEQAKKRNLKLFI